MMEFHKPLVFFSYLQNEGYIYVVIGSGYVLLRQSYYRSGDRQLGEIQLKLAAIPHTVHSEHCAEADTFP